MLYWHNMTESENQDVTRMLIYKGSLSAVTKLILKEKGGRMGLDNFGGYVRHLCTSLGN